MIEIITAWGINQILAYTGGAIAAIILGWIIKKIPFNDFASWVEKLGKSQGVAVTTFFSTWKYTKAVYGKVIEPVFIDTLNAVFFAWIRGFVAGLKSDN